MATNLYLTTGYGGSIWNGRPNPADPPPQLYKEYSDPSSTEYLYQIAADNVVFNAEFTAIVVGDEGSIIGSNRNGAEIAQWDILHTASGPLYGIAYGNNTWIACGKNNLVVKNTGGTTWTEHQGAVPGAKWQWMTFGAGRFVAVGGVTLPDPNNPGQDIKSGAIMYSDDDGATWIKGNSGTDKYLYSVTYSPELNIFVAVGEGGAIVSVNG
jgi:hypothetical protein